MPSIVFERCQHIVQLCKDKLYFKEIPIADLKQIIAENIGGDPRTLKLYLSRLQYFGFMKQVNDNVMQIQPANVNRDAVREQQRTLDEAILRQWGIKA